MAPDRDRKPVTRQKRAGRVLLLFTGLMVAVVLAAGAGQTAVHGGAFFVSRGAGVGATPDSPAAPPPARAAHARTVAAPAIYDWVITLQWSGGMLTCAGKSPAVSGYALFLAALATCRKLTGPDAVVIVWTASKNALAS